MKLLRTVDLNLTSIKMPGDFKSHLDPTVIAELTRTIEASAAINGDAAAYVHSGLPPVVLDQGHRLHAGRNRYMAAKAAGVKSVRADVIEFTSPQEAEILELKENLHRKHLDADVEAKLTRRLVDLVTAQVEAERESATELQNDEVASKPGRKKSARGEAVERVAAGAGVTRQAIEKRIERADQDDQDDEPAAPVVAPINTWGLSPAPNEAELFARAAAVQKAMDAVSSHVARAMAAISEAMPNMAGWPAVQNLKEELHQLGRVARALRPEALCPFCKGMVDNCPSCHDRRLVGAGEVERAPEELKLGGDQAMVCIGPGEIVTLGQGGGRTFGKARGVHVPKNGKGKGGQQLPSAEPKQVKVVDEFGNPIPF